MNGAASGLIEAYKEAFELIDPETPWLSVPFGGTSWFKYGGGGIGGWASLCSAGPKLSEQGTEPASLVRFTVRNTQHHHR